MTASKNSEAPLVTIAFRVPIEEAQALIDAAKAGGAKAVKTEATDYNQTVTYVTAQNEEGKTAFQF